MQTKGDVQAAYNADLQYHYGDSKNIQKHPSLPLSIYKGIRLGNINSGTPDKCMKNIYFIFLTVQSAFLY